MKILRTMGAFVCLFFATVFFLPIEAQAASIWSEVTVSYIVFNEDGSWHYCATDTQDQYLGKKAVLSCPDENKVLNVIMSLEGTISYTEENARGQKVTKEGYYGQHHFYLASEQNTLKMLPGVYTLEDFELPDGYEYDSAMGKLYPMSVSITQEDIDDYAEWARNFTETGGRQFSIYIPVKKTGEVSAVLRKPETPQLVIGEDNMKIGPSEYQSLYSIEYEYAETENGVYKKLGDGNSNDNYYYFNTTNCPLKHGSTYYIKARYYKTVNDEKIYGDFGTPVAVKVVKSEVGNYKITLKLKKKVTKKAGKKVTKKYLKVQGAPKNYKIKLFYTTKKKLFNAKKKKGIYKELEGTFSAKTQLSTIKKLKKVTTYYVKARLLDDSFGEEIYGSYTKAVKVKK